MNAIKDGVKICVECRFYGSDGRCFHPDSVFQDPVSGAKWRTARERRAVRDYSLGRHDDACGFDGNQWEAVRDVDSAGLGGCMGILIALAIMAVLTGAAIAVWG